MDCIDNYENSKSNYDLNQTILSVSIIVRSSLLYC